MVICGNWEEGLSSIARSRGNVEWWIQDELVSYWWEDYGWNEWGSLFLNKMPTFRARVETKSLLFWINTSSQIQYNHCGKNPSVDTGKLRFNRIIASRMWPYWLVSHFWSFRGGHSLWSEVLSVRRRGLLSVPFWLARPSKSKASYPLPLLRLICKTRAHQYFRAHYILTQK